jgi:hypothetical protein
MKVVIGKYPTWVGPYQIAKALCFWTKPDTDWVHDFGTWLANDKSGKESLLAKTCNWIESKRKRQVYVRVDKFDTWGMDHTLAHIITPMLVQLQASKHGAPQVDDSDVPEHLKSTNAEPKDSEYDCDSNHFLRWDWVLDEMIFAFESKLDDSWEDQFRSGESQLLFKKLENGMSEMVKGPNDTKKYDWEGRKAYTKRISNGFRLFGKYYEGLWD